MRRKNWRMVIVGLALIVLASLFFLYMMSLAPTSTDPVQLMRTAGTVVGVVCALSLLMIVVGLVGRKS